MPYRTLLCTAAALAALTSLSACGSEESNGSSSGASKVEPGNAPSSPPAAVSKLTIKVRASANAPEKVWTLSCDPVGGDHPAAPAACAALTKVKDPFAPTPAGRMCTEIYGGPEVATITGRWLDRPISAKITRINGCEIHRWSRLGPALGTTPPVR